MNLKRLFILYLILLHLSIGIIGTYWLQEQSYWIYLLDGGLVVSFLLAFFLLQRLFQPFQQLTTALELLKGKDVTTGLHAVPYMGLNELVLLYNRMRAHLYDERQRLEKQFRFMERILHVSPLGILTLDFDRRVVMVNPSALQLLKMSEKELLGASLDDCTGPLFQDLITLAPQESRLVFLPNNARIRCQRLQFMDQGFFRNFYLLEELTAELYQSEKEAYETVIRTLSHETNNSLGSVNSLLQSCLNYQGQLRQDDQADFEMALTAAIERMTHLNRFMRDFAEVVRLPQPQWMPCDLQSMLENLVVLMKAHAAEKQIEWIWQVQGDFQKIKMDPHQMEQVFLNLLKNAMEAIEAQGTITLMLEHQAGVPTVTIEDTGKGIAPDIQKKLFLPFFSTKPSGQGIGLTLIQEILLQHGFSFHFESQPQGPTRFTIHLKKV